MSEKARILFVDDAPDILMISTIRLRKLGYEVLTASSGDEGIKIALEKRPSLIFLDIMMPDKDGLEVCREIKANPELKDIPVVLFSAISEDTIREKLSYSGADDYLLKPFESHELTGKVEKYCG
jgi:CheY-like chemotaxis protein